MKKRILLFASLAALLMSGVISCGETKRGEYVSGAATIYCDEGFKAILDEEIEVFEYTYPESSIVPFYVDEVRAINAIMEDSVQSVITTKELTEDQIKYLKAKYKRVVRQKCIAVDAVALIVNKDNPVSQLSTKEISEILNGEISRWDQLAGNDTTRIRLVFDNAGSSTVSYLRSRFLNDKGQITDHAYATAVKSNAQVFDIVKKDKNAIGVLSVSWLGEDLEVAKKVPLEQRMEDYKVTGDTIGTNLTQEVNILKVSNPTEENDFSAVGYKPYQAYIASGEYPLFRKVYMITTDGNRTLLYSFYTFITGPIGQKIMMKTGILPFSMNPRVINLIEN